MGWRSVRSTTAALAALVSTESLPLWALSFVSYVSYARLAAMTSPLLILKLAAIDTLCDRVDGKNGSPRKRLQQNARPAAHLSA
jgi:hypothetical protein